MTPGLQSPSSAGGLALALAEDAPASPSNFFRALTQVGLAITSSLDLTHVLNLICEQSLAVFGVHHAIVWLVEGKELRAVASRGAAGEETARFRVSLTDESTLTVRVMRARQPLFVNHVTAETSGVNQQLAQLHRTRSVLGIPLIFGERELGALVLVDSQDPARFSERDLDGALLFGAQAAMAIEHARLYDEQLRLTNELELQVEARTRVLRLTYQREQALRNQLEVLHQGAVLLRQELDLDVLLQKIADLACDIGQAQSAILVLPGVARSHAHLFTTPIETIDIQQLGLRVGHDVFVSARREADTDTPRLPTLRASTPVLQLPIEARGQLVAMLYLYDRERADELAEPNERVVEMLATHAAIAIENAQLFKRQQLLAQLSREVTSGFDLDEILRLIMSRLREHIQFRRGLIALINSDYELYVAAADPKMSPGASSVRLPVGAGLVGWIAARGEPFYSPDLDAEKEIAPAYRDPGSPYARSYLGVPLITNRKVIGVLSIDSVAKHAFTQNDRELLEAVAVQVAGAIENARLYRELQRTSVAQRESEERYRDLVENVDDLVYAHDLTGRILMVNRKAEQISGYTRGELTDMNIQQLLTPEALDKFIRGFDTLLANGSGSGTFQVRAKTGQVITGQVRATVITRNGKPVGVRGVMRDLTRVREMEELLTRSERLATLGQIAASVSHELRNPLGAMSNALYYLKTQLASSRDPKILRHLDIVERQIKIANRIIGDLLTFSRQPSVEKELTPLAPLCVDALGASNIGHNIAVDFRIEPMQLVLADRDKLFQVMQNLIANAVQAMPRGGKLYIAGNPFTENEKQWIRISVADTGIGISPENQERIFAPLFTTRARGIGLGLTICKSIIEAHGGRIGLESPLPDALQTEQSQGGNGTVFYIDLPNE